MARKLGIRGKLPLDLSLALGSCEVTPFELAHVFNTIAAGGVCSRPHLITRVTATGSGSDQLGLGLGLSSKSQVLYKHRSKKKVVVSRHICQDLHRMLRSAVTRGTGRPATKGWPSVLAAGKTGTSDDYRDAWFAGYTPSLTCVVWCGRDDNSSLPGSGATLAAPLWAKFMRAASGTGGYATDKGQSNKRAKKKNKNTFMR
jgi:penicillin-binding protein 1B